MPECEEHARRIRLLYREPLHCKVHYRKLFLQDVLARIDECDTATDVANSVNILVAIRWVFKAWVAVKETTICKSFEKLVYWTLL